MFRIRPEGTYSDIHTSMRGQYGVRAWSEQRATSREDRGRVKSYDYEMTLELRTVGILPLKELQTLASSGIW